MKVNWQTKKLDDICNVEYGTRVVNKKDGGSLYPVYGGGGATFFIDKYNREDRVVIARFAMSEWCTRFVKGRFFLNDSGLTISPKNSNEITQDFLNYQAFYLNDTIYALAKGSAQKNLDVPAFRDLEILYPDSISEQTKIVKILDEAFEKIARAKENAEKNLQNSEELFDAYQEKIFTSRKKDWVEKKLGEIATFRNGMNFTKGSKGERIKIVGVKDFQKSFWVPFETLESVTIDGKLSDIDTLKKDDILAVRSNGNPALIGRMLLAGHVPSNASHSGFTIRIRINTKGVYPLYLCHYLKSQKARKELVASGTGVNIKSLNQQALTSLSVSIPSLEEQKAIVKDLETFSEQTIMLKENYKRKIEELEELKKSLLHEAFTGKL